MSKKYLFGYRLGDKFINLPTIPATKVGTSIQRTEEEQSVNRLNMGRTPMAVSLPMCTIGAPTVPDKQHIESRLAGFHYRVGRAMPEPNPAIAGRFKRWVQGWVKRNIEPLETTEEMDFEEFLSSTTYNEDRKSELRKCKEMLDNADVTKKLINGVKGFTKEEDYKGFFKHFRTINSRSDFFKVVSGPLFKMVERKLFKLPEFIKKIPNRERSDYIMENVHTENGTYITTDYTSFEASFTKRIMANCECLLYRYMFRNHPLYELYLKVEEVILGINRIKYQGFVASIPACRMSGEMNTSLGNGFSNLMLFKFACHIHRVNMRGVVEGDDGLFNVGREFDPEIFRHLGFDIKFEKHLNIGDASFCGQVFDPEARQLVRDPIQTIIAMNWSTSRYVQARSEVLSQLQLSRALSLLSEYPATPVLNEYCALAVKIFKFNDRLMSKILRMENDVFKRERLERVLSDLNSVRLESPKIETRLLVEKRYGLSVEVQLMMEEFLRHSDGTDLHKIPLFDLFLTYGNRVMEMVYVKDVPVYNDSIGCEMETGGSYLDYFADRKRAGNMVAMWS